MGKRLLNFNRFMANFSTKLMGAFVPVIVYKYAPAYKMQMAILTIVIQYFLSFVLTLLFKNILIKKPQVFLFLRVVPVIIYEVLLIFIDSNPWPCVIGIGVAYSLSYVFKYVPTESLFAYNNTSLASGTGKNLAFAKIVDQSAIIIGTIFGGFVLDYLSVHILVIISISLYIIGALPLLIYYIVNKKDKSLNQEYSTYEHIALKEKSSNTRYANSVSKKVRVIYCLYYFLQESYNAMYVLMPLFVFKLTGKFSYSAIAGAIFDGVYGVGCYLTAKLESKRDITIMSATAGVMVGVCGISMVFMRSNTLILFYLLVAIMALCYSMTYFFMYNRMILKSKIIGRNITCVTNKINMFFLSTSVVVSFGLFLPINACFCIAGGLSIVAGLSSPHVEEKTRRILVDHLEDNEIREDRGLFSSRR